MQRFSGLRAYDESGRASKSVWKEEFEKSYINLTNGMASQVIV